MAYSTSNPPQLIAPSIGGKPALWIYTSTHSSTEIIAASFFSNGSNLGMKAGDLLLSVISSSFTPCLTAVSSVAASSAATVVPSTV